MRANKLMTLMMVLMLIGIAISLFTFWTVYHNRADILQSIEKNVRSELARYDIPTSEDLKIDDANILLAVAKYCEVHNNCAGAVGLQGPQGLQGIQGLIGIQGQPGTNGLDGEDGYTPLKGVDYFDGEQGPPGNDGRKIIQRCNSDRDRIEWQYEGDENWQPLYNLAPRQTCVEGS